MPIIPEFRRQRQEDFEFKASMGNISMFVSENKTHTQTWKKTYE
jgi:hypothetical protein